MQNGSHIFDALLPVQSAIQDGQDLRTVFYLVLDQVTGQLQVDAAAILTYHPMSAKFEYAAGRGFKAEEIELPGLLTAAKSLRQAILERQEIHIPDLQGKREVELAPFYEREGFVTYHGLPLMDAQQVLGVMEIWHRQALVLGEQSMSILRLVAAETAHAMNHARLIDQLQKANREMERAYDATIEGWVRALDLRDRNTTGHSLRVTRLTIQLASKLGFNGDQLVQVKNGALLHDIGKLALPDAILFKPDKLTSEEQALMRQHTTLGYQLLTDIPFLRPALDIVYCHHERWDGSGYPRGLKGEQIPLSARIFAVVDVWDALVMDRAHRPGLSRESAVAYLKEKAGVEFDPQVVEAFLTILDE